MTNQLITHLLLIDYSLVLLMSSISSITFGYNKAINGLFHSIINAKGHGKGQPNK